MADDTQTGNMDWEIMQKNVGIWCCSNRNRMMFSSSRYQGMCRG